MSERDYLKGVPLRLGKTFYPVARPQFKEIDIHIPLDALQEEYDFGLEKNVIESFQSYHLEKNRLLIEAEKRLKLREEKAVAAEQERIEAEELKKEKEGKQSRSEFSPVILQNSQSPKTLQPHYCDPPVHKDSIVNRVTNLTANLNLSDFESDTANPFDSAEMNSINDKAELASIWANHLDLTGASLPSVPRTDSKYQQQEHCHMNGVAMGTGMASTQGYYPTTSINNVTTSSWNSQQWNPNRVIPYQTTTTSGTSVSVPNTSASSMPPHPSSHTNPTNLNSPASNSNSFTKIHFPFLTSYTQSSRAAERSYHQQFNTVPPTSIMQPFPTTTVVMPNDQIRLNGPNNLTPSQSYGNWSTAHHFPSNK